MDILSQILENDKKTDQENKKQIIEAGENPEIDIVEKPEENFSINQKEDIHENESSEETAFFNDSETHEETEDFDQPIKDPVVTEKNRLYASLYADVLDIIAVMILKWISGKQDEEGDEKFSMSNKNKKALAKAWFEILELEQKQLDPKTAFYKMLAAIYLPMTFTAVQMGIKSKKLKKESEVNKQKQQATPVQSTEVKQPDISGFYTEPKEELSPENFNDPFFGMVPGEEIEKNGVKYRFNGKILDKIENQKPVTYSPVDQKNTAVLQNIEKQPEKEILPTGKKRRGRRKGSKKNPKTGIYEMPESNVVISGKLYRVYSWGEKTKVKQ